MEREQPALEVLERRDALEAAGGRRGAVVALSRRVPVELAVEDGIQSTPTESSRRRQTRESIRTIIG